MKLILKTVNYQGMKFGVGKHDLAVGPAKALFVAVSAGNLSQVVQPTKAVPWLVKHGLTKAKATRLVGQCRRRAPNKG